MRLLFLILSGGLLLATAPTVKACKCAEPSTIREAFDGADEVGPAKDRDLWFVFKCGRSSELKSAADDLLYLEKLKAF